MQAFTQRIRMHDVFRTALKNTKTEASGSGHY